MPPLRCPVCKADNSAPPACRRCKADLSPLWEVEAARDGLLADARRHAAAGRWSAFLNAVLRAHALRSDDQTRRLRAAGYLLIGGRVSALRHALPSGERPV